MAGEREGCTETVPYDRVLGAIADDSTVLEVSEADNEPTTVRPSPPPELGAREADDGGPATIRGSRVGKYELRGKLGRGAFGVVFTARDPSLDRDVAIKVLRPAHLANPTIVHRFLQEARAAARIAHPGIVTVHDCGQVETSHGMTAFIAMELLSGESLTRRLGRCGRLAPDAAVEIARQVASALEAAHRADVLHRDLKPDNIYLVPDPAMPSGERVKVLDFGLAKLGHAGHTQLQTVFGTPRYMSPEQGRSTAQVDHRSDIYSLGCILFELVTGRPPFAGDVRQLLLDHQHATPPRASSLAPATPAALDEVIAEMLAKDPLERPQTMGAVQRALRSGEAPTERAALEEPMRAPEEPAEGPVVPAGPVAAGPIAAGPVAAGPIAAGPIAVGPVAAGPVIAAALPTVASGPRLGPGAPTIVGTSVRPPSDPGDSSGEILVSPSGPRLALAEAVVAPAAPVAAAKLFWLGAVIVAVSAFVAWITG
jgi:serine/threonine-protein kinase